MSSSKFTPLSETTRFIVDNRGKTVPTVEYGIPLIATNCIKNNSLYPVYERLRYISQDIFDNWFRAHLEPNDIILTLKGSQNGAVCLVPDTLGFAIAQDMVGLRVNEDVIDLKYLFAVLRSNEIQTQIKNLDVSGVIPHLKKSDFDKLFIPRLGNKIEKFIGKTYYDFCKKIDLLHQQNQTLEDMAQTLFREWFIERANEGWEEGKLPDEFDFLMGVSPKGNTFNEEKIGAPMFQGNADFGFRFPKNRIYTTDPKRFADRYDTLVSVRAPVGAQNMAKQKCCIGRGLASFKYKNNKNFYTYTYYKLMSLMDEIKAFNNSGTVFGSISKTDFQNINIILPPKNIVENFENIAKPINDKIIQNEEQIKSLEQTRDTLLPKLLSGVV